MSNKKNPYVKPVLMKHGALLEITKGQGQGKYPGPGDGHSNSNDDTCPWGHYKKGTCSPGAFS